MFPEHCQMHGYCSRPRSDDRRKTVGEAMKKTQEALHNLPCFTQGGHAFCVSVYFPIFLLFYAVRIVLKESRLLVLPGSSCNISLTSVSRSS
jgi:hypothetical protein